MKPKIIAEILKEDTIRTGVKTPIKEVGYTYIIDGYNDRNLEMFKHIALFKFGQNNAMRIFVNHYSKIIERLPDPSNYTLIAPVTKSPLKRPIVHLAFSLAADFNMKVLLPEFVKKNKTPTSIHYTNLNSIEDRIKRGENTINITPNSISSSKIYILDDTFASGGTIINYANSAFKTHQSLKEAKAYVYAKLAPDCIYLEDIINQLPIWEMKYVSKILNSQQILTTTSSRKLLDISHTVFIYLLKSLSEDAREFLANSWKYFWDRDAYITKKDILMNISDFNDLRPEITVWNSSIKRGPIKTELYMFESLEDFEKYQKLNIPIKQISDIFIVKDRGQYVVYRNMGHGESLYYVAQLNRFKDLTELVQSTLLADEYILNE